MKFNKLPIIFPQQKQFFSSSKKTGRKSNPFSRLKFNDSKKILIFQHQDGERYLKNLTRISMIMMVGNAALITLQIINPFFGFWHGLSLSVGFGFSLAMAAFLQIKSRRFINKIWIRDNLKQIDIQYFNAFWVPKPIQTYNIQDFGYLEDSRWYNTQYATYQQKYHVYICIKNNRYNKEILRGIDPQKALEKIFSGSEVV